MPDKNKELLFPDYVFDKKLGKYLFIKKIILSPIYALIFILYPIYLFFKLFEFKTFSKILKRILFIIYLIFMTVLIYTIFIQNRRANSNEQVIIELDFKDTIENIK